MISKAEKKDLKELYDISIKCLPGFESFDAFLASFENPAVSVYVFKDGEKIAGYVSFSVVLDEGEILDIAVLPQYRRKGIGLALIESIKVPVLFLEVRESNKSAISFYKKIGFSAISTRSKYYKNPTEDAVIMKKHMGM